MGKLCKNEALAGFPGGRVAKDHLANAGDMGSVSGLERSHVPQSN